jgi:hypothetical protein
VVLENAGFGDEDFRVVGYGKVGIARCRGREGEDGILKEWKTFSSRRKEAQMLQLLVFAVLTIKDACNLIVPCRCFMQ